MTDLNHRRKNKEPKNQRHQHYNNGFGCLSNAQNKSIRGSIKRVGNTDQLDKSMHGWVGKAEIGNNTIIVSAFIGNDFCDGHRGMAKAVKGAKKFIRTRIRAKSKEALYSSVNELYEK